MRRKISQTILFSALIVGTAGIAAIPRVAIDAYARQPGSQTISTQRFRLDAGQSKFIVHALRGGLLWFKGHEHLVAACEFTGETFKKATVACV